MADIAENMKLKAIITSLCGVSMLLLRKFDGI